MTTGYVFELLDPRPQGADANDAVFEAARNGVLGIEITIPTLAERCTLGNLDHHGPVSTSETPSACEQALEMYKRAEWNDWPGDDITLVTVRADADSVMAMAVFAYWEFERSQSASYLPWDHAIVREIGRMDRLGPAGGPYSPKAVAIARVTADFRRPLKERVDWVEVFLRWPDDRKEEVEALCAETEAELEAARQASEITVVADGRIATVVSTHRMAFQIGYEVAPVVVALNPAMPVQDGEPIVKYTIARYDNHIPCDIMGAAADLDKIERGWGGRGDIAGSPQGVSSKLTLEQVVEAVTHHLK